MLLVVICETRKTENYIIDISLRILTRMYCVVTYIELEHGTVSPKTNVTNDNLITTAKIALAHLNEFPNYYNPEYGLRQFEKLLQSKL